MRYEEAKAIIDALVKLRESATDEQASAAASLYPTLKGDGSLVKAGTRINWNGEVMRAAVDLWDVEGSDPENAPSLWEAIGYRDGYRIIPEVITVGTAFSKGERGWWDGELYSSILDANVWTPQANPSGWEKVTL